MKLFLSLFQIFIPVFLFSYSKWKFWVLFTNEETDMFLFHWHSTNNEYSKQIIWIIRQSYCFSLITTSLYFSPITSISIFIFSNWLNNWKSLSKASISYIHTISIHCSHIPIIPLWIFLQFQTRIYKNYLIFHFIK